MARTCQYSLLDENDSGRAREEQSGFIHLHLAVVQKLNGLLSSAVVLYSGIGDEEEKSAETGPTSVVPDVVAAAFDADKGI